MTAQTAVAPVSAGVAISQITGAASGDTLPAGSTVLVFNSGAGSHNFTLGVNATFDGLAVGTSGTRVYAVSAGAYRLIKVPNSYGDANGLCSVAIDGTATEVKYWLIAA